MAKRFTATDKWNDPWFRKLPPKAKIIWLYLVDACDNAGFWLVDFELASFLIGDNVTAEDIIPFLNGRVIIHKDCWEITKFIKFQYGNLSKDCRPHKVILDRVEKQRVSKGYPKGINTLVDMEVDKEVDKKEGCGEKTIIPTLDDVKAYCLERKNDVNAEKWFNFYASKGWMIGRNKMKDWKASVRTWESTDGDILTDTQKRNIKKFKEFEKGDGHE